jgi:hypothetical protein
MATDTLPCLGQQLVQGNNVHISVHPNSVDMPTGDRPAVGDHYGSVKDKSACN